MRMSNIKEKALRSVHIREVKLRMRAKKQAKLSGQESEKARMNRVNKLLNGIRKGKMVWLWKQLVLKESESVCTYPIFLIIPSPNRREL